MLTGVAQVGVPNVNRIDLTGQRFSRWVVLHADAAVGRECTWWVCRCDCGTVRSVRGHRLRKGLSKACGCSRRERVSQMMSASLGEQNHSWRGTEASYFAKHRRVYTVRGQPRQCDECGTTDPTRTYEWASMTQQYDDVNDYRRMCRSCHHKHDNTIRFVEGWRDKTRSTCL